MLKVLIVSVILVAFAIMGLAIKLVFDKDAEFIRHSCGGEMKKLNDANDCATCGITKVTNSSKSEK